MNSLFESLRRRFAASGISEAYTNRLIEELQLHYAASVERNLLGGLSQEEAEAAAMAGLGSEEEIVRTTLDTLRRESFIGRHRFLSLIVAPPVLLELARYVIAFGSFFLFNEVGLLPDGTHYTMRRFRDGGRIELALTEALFNLILPLAFIATVWLLGRRKFCGLGYALGGCLVLMYFGFSPTFALRHVEPRS